MARFVSNEPVTLTRDLDADETGYSPAGAVTVAVGDGEPVAATAEPDSTVYTAAVGVLPLGVHEVTWRDGESVIYVDALEVVGTHLCTVADIRAGDSEFANKTRFTPALLRTGREYVADEFDAITGRSFVRRSAQVWEYSDGSGWWLTGLRDSPVITAIAVDGSPADASAYTIDENGVLEGPALDESGRMVVVTVEYGFTRVPEDVRRVAAIRVRSVVAQSDGSVPDRATSIVSPDGGQMTLATAGRAGYETGIPEVDAVLARYTFRIERDLVGML